jgi:DNA-binding transcriptional LysR family regulator
LTPRAQSLYKLLEPDLDTMLTRLGRILDKERPLLRVGLPQAIFYYLFPAVMTALRQEYPELEIVAYERDTAIPDLIKSGSIDICITERFFGDPAVPQHLVGSYKLSLVYPAEWAAPAREDILSWATDKPFITYEPGQLLRDIALDYLSRDGRQPSVAISTSGSSSVKKCVENGLGFGIIPTWCLEAEEHAIRAIGLDDLPTIPIYFGEAQFLQNNPVVLAARRIFGEVAAPRLT